MTITRRDIERALDILDPDAKEFFLSMPDEERQAILLSIETSNSNRIAIVEKRQIEFERDIRNYRRQREMREDDDSDEAMNTTQKILRAIAEHEASKFNYVVWFRDRVFPQIVTLITLAILY